MRKAGARPARHIAPQVKLCTYVAAVATLVDMLTTRATGTLMVLSAALVVISCFWDDYDTWMEEESHM